MSLVNRIINAKATVKSDCPRFYDNFATPRNTTQKIFKKFDDITNNWLLVDKILKIMQRPRLTHLTCNNLFERESSKTSLSSERGHRSLNKNRRKMSEI